ncbi:7168_t:CDS:2, partial [Funneliformis geosporum]
MCSPIALPELLRDITIAIDRAELYVDGDRSFDPKNTLNGLLNMANGQVNNLMNNMSNAINYGYSLGVVRFNDGIKTNILVDKMAGTFTPPNIFNDSVGNAIITPALFIAWLREIYCAVKLETYEKQIRPRVDLEAGCRV